MFLFCFIIMFLLSVMYLEWHNKLKGSPPGPKRLPLVGSAFTVYNLLKKFKCHHLAWEHLKKKYGPIVRVQIGLTNLVIVFDRNLIKEVLIRDEFNGRPGGFFYLLRSFGKRLGLVFTEGEKWRAGRIFALKSFKFVGAGLKVGEDWIINECLAQRSLLDKNGSAPVYVNNMFKVHSVNIIWTMITGEKLEPEHENCKFLSKHVYDSLEVLDMTGGWLNFFPLLRFVIPKTVGYSKLKNIYDALYKFIDEKVKSQLSELDINNPRGLMDIFIMEMLRDPELCSSEEVRVLCVDILQAGTETVNNTLVFLMLYMILNPTVQSKVQNEIDNAIGKEGAITYSDKAKLPYVDAVILEGLRMSTVAPVGIAHSTTEDARLDKYLIKKDSVILLSLYSVHMDKTIWLNPTEFKPERFLDSNGNLKQNDNLISFGYGKRRCIGEALARQELFLIFTYIMQMYRIEIPPGYPVPTTDPVDGVAISAKPFYAKFTKRYD